MRLISVTGNVGTEPEAKHGRDGARDFVKFRFASQEYNESEPWWITILCYGKEAKTALDRITVGDRLLLYGDLLQPYGDKKTVSVVLKSFEWLPKQGNKEDETKPDDLDFHDFDDIEEIEF